MPSLWLLAHWPYTGQRPANHFGKAKIDRFFAKMTERPLVASIGRDEWLRNPFTSPPPSAVDIPHMGL
jgi:hypothetical protein